MENREIQRATVRGQWNLFLVVLLLIGLGGILRDWLLIPSLVIGTGMTAGYYFLLSPFRGMRHRVGLVIQPTFLTLFTLTSFLFLEEPLFKVVLLFVLVFLHAFFLFNIRYACASSPDTPPQVLRESVRIIVPINLFLLAVNFFAPLFYFDVRFAFLYAVPFLCIAGLIIWNALWIENKHFSDRLFLTLTMILIICEVSTALIWLPVSYMVQAFFVSGLFFILTEWMVNIRDHESEKGKSFFFALLLLLFVVFWIVISVQWR